jgi:3-oxoadipate CoA-transferase, alpha subunit
LINKQVKTSAEAVAGINDGAIVLVAGFGAVGVAVICWMHFTIKAPRS